MQTTAKKYVSEHLFTFNDVIKDDHRAIFIFQKCDDSFTYGKQIKAEIFYFPFLYLLLIS